MAAPSSLPPLAPLSSSGAQAPDFDLFRPLRSTGSRENPYPVYQLLRTVRPVLRVPVDGWEGPGSWLLTRYNDVHDALRNPTLSAERMKAPLIRENLDRLPDFIRQSAMGLRSMLTMDPPDHTRVRKLANKAFTPRRIAQLRKRVQQIVDDALDLAQEKGEIDLIHDLAEPLPAIVIAELLGVPAEDHRKFRAWSSQLINAIGAEQAEERQRLAGDAGAKLLGYLADIIAERRREPQDDLISALVSAQEENDALTDEELLATTNLILLAGHETTTNLIGNGMLALLREPEELARLREHPGLMPKAVEEFLRFDGPVQATLRIATENLEVGGQEVETGSILLLNLGAANHDPEVFERPERLDVGRDPNPHLAFGFGTHFCMGAPTARLEAEIAFRSLIQRFPNIALMTDNPEYRPNPVLRGLKALPLSL